VIYKLAHFAQAQKSWSYVIVTSESCNQYFHTGWSYWASQHAFRKSRSGLLQVTLLNQKMLLLICQAHWDSVE